MSAARTAYARNRDDGLTLIELALVIALIVVMSVFVAPSWTAWWVRDQVDSRARTLLTALAYARGEAMREGARVRLCRSDVGTGCLSVRQPCAEGRMDWSCGWAIVAQREGKPVILRRYAAERAVAVSSNTSALVFTPPAGQVFGGFRSFELTPHFVSSGWSGERWRRCLRIAAGGRARLVEGGCKAKHDR